MYRIRLAIVAFLLATIGLQAQEGFYYQAVIKNTDGSPLKETPVKIRIRIIEGTTTLQYEEEKEVTTSREGFVSFIIGEGATTDFTSINWQGELYLQDEIDTGDGYGAPTRMPLLKTPRSYISDRAISVLDNSITSASILDGTISNDDLSAAASISFSKLSISASDIEGLGFLQSDENFTSDLKDKLDGIEAGANAYSLPTATSDILGGVKVGTGITIADGVISIGQAVGTSDDVSFNTVTSDLTGDVTGNLLGNVTGNAETATTLSATLSIDKGGTGATTAADARTNLDVDQAGTDNSTNVTLATVTDNYLSLTGQEITAGNVPISLGGTGATTAADARTNLDVDQAGTDNSTNVTLATVTDNYLSLTGQEITAGNVPISLGGTGATTAADARTNLDVDQAGTDNSTNVTLATVTDNYLSLTGQEITAGNVPISLGGTGATTAADARTNLDVDQAGTDNSTNVTLATVTDNYLSLTGQEITAGNVPISLGGTGATTAADARTNLDVDQAGTDNSTNVTLATVTDNYLSLTGQEITAGNVPISLGGTGATTAADARTNLDVDQAGTDNSTNVTLATVTDNYLSLTGQEITAGNVPISLGGTGATTAADARTNLDVDQAGTDNSTNVTLATVTDNYLSLTGQEITAGNVPISLGGTGATTAADARTNLDVDQAGTDNSTNVTLATVTDNYLSLTGQEITAGNVPISLGGTGATTAADARTNLDMFFGTGAIPVGQNSETLTTDDYNFLSGVDSNDIVIITASTLTSTTPGATSMYAKCLTNSIEINTANGSNVTSSSANFSFILIKQ